MIKQPLKNKITFKKNELVTLLVVALIFLESFILEINFILPLFLLGVYFYLRNTKLKYNLLYISCLFVLLFVFSYFVIRNGIPFYYIPFAAFPMLCTILFASLELSLLLTLVAAFSISFLSNNNYLGLLFFTSGVMSLVLVRNARTRSVIIRTGFIIGAIQALALFFINNFKINFTDTYSMFALNGLVSSIIVIGFLPIFEYIFNTITNISLLELADFNHPLLQRMVLEAPGTYHHSLVVGNLSEAACQAVGANALLARIGAYYHDIGKLQKPEYFSENINSKFGKHDNLTPTMSRLVIMNHVNEGVELARKHNLNSKLIDFIKQHHGTSLVYYFYRRALESLEEDNEVLEEGFRYPGPKPNSKEVAIVLLADSVEAASRALKDPAPINIRNVVH
ncbi:MAG: hypothetical protein DRP74_01460, partial [Candidatus Omnitrophota bacterium]